MKFDFFSNADVNLGSYFPAVEKFIFACAITLGSISTANADILCLKNNQSVSKSKVNLSSAIKVATTNNCPSGYKPLLDTNSFKGDLGTQGSTGLQGEKGDTGSQGAPGIKGDKGDKGDSGLPALSRSTCQSRYKQIISVVDDAHRQATPVSFSCEKGEYAHVAKFDDGSCTTDGFVLDYGNGYKEYGCYNNTSPGDVSQDANYSGGVSTLNVLDDEGIFLVGVMQTPWTMPEQAVQIIGSMTLTHGITLTCCLLGD